MSGQSNDSKDFLVQVHDRPKKSLQDWLDYPAHIHHSAYRLTDPPSQRPQSHQEFRDFLKCLQFKDDDCLISDRFGFGVLSATDGDRLVAVWEAHTEYFSYQLWHIPADKAAPLALGPLAFPDYRFPFCPIGTRVNALDILVTADQRPAAEYVRKHLSGRRVYASRVFGREVCVATIFTPDEHGRERYVVFSDSAEPFRQQLPQLIDTIAYIENYYHLILLPFAEFSDAVDRIHDFEQRHLQQRELITTQIRTASADSLLSWVTVLTEDFMKVSRLAEAMRYRLSAAAPYDAIVRENLQSLQERKLSPYRPLSSYVLGRISGVADGYEQLCRRLDALEADFQATIAVIRTRVYLLLQDQNVTLLSSVDRTTKSQAILQHTVEGLSVIVITYYLSGLSSYVFKALQKMDVVVDADLATAVFIPVALGLAVGAIVLGRRFINKRFSRHRP